MFFPISDAKINRDGVDWIEWRNERFVLHVGKRSLSFSTEYTGQAVDLARTFIRDHNMDQINPDKIAWVEPYGDCLTAYLESSIHNITDPVEIEKLEKVLSRGRRKK